MSITLELTSEEEILLRRAAQGRDVTSYIKSLILPATFGVARNSEGEDAEQTQLRAIILNGAGIVQSKPRSDGRAWSEIEGFPV